MRTFNTEGPVVAEDHYCIPPLERIDLDTVLGLVRGKKYFVLHARIALRAPHVADRLQVDDAAEGDATVPHAVHPGATAQEAGVGVLLDRAAFFQAEANASDRTLAADRRIAPAEGARREACAYSSMPNTTSRRRTRISPNVPSDSR